MQLRSRYVPSVYDNVENVSTISSEITYAVYIGCAISVVFLIFSCFLSWHILNQLETAVLDSTHTMHKRLRQDEV